MATVDDGEVESGDGRLRGSGLQDPSPMAVRTPIGPVGGGPPLVFVSYAHADADILERLSLVLRPLVREGRVDIWADARIGVGRRWDEEIEGALRRADIALLLVSSDFLASDYIVRVELPRLVQREVPLVCVPVSECAWRDLEAVATVQWPLPPDRPLRSMPWDERESALVRVYAAVKELLARMDPVRPAEAIPASEPRSTRNGGKPRSAVLPSVSPPRPNLVERVHIARRPLTISLAVALVVLIATATFGLTRGNEREPQTVADRDTTPSSSPAVTSSPTPVETTTTRTATSIDSRRSGAGSPASQEAAAPPSTTPPTSGPAPAPVVPSPSPPADEPQAGQWKPQPSGLEGHCTGTEQAGPNLWYQICWSGATPMLVVTVSGVTGQSPNHQVAVPRIWTIVNGIHSRGTSCPLRTVTIGQSFACVDETGSSAPGMNVESYGRLMHDGVESVLFTRRL